MVLVVKALRRDPHFKVRFLTAVNDEWAKEEKSNWLHDRFWFLREKDIIFVPYGKNKSDYIPDPKPSDILLDDHTPNCVAWSGKAIKVVNDIFIGDVITREAHHLVENRQRVA